MTRPQAGRVLQAVKTDIESDPVNIGMFCANAVAIRMNLRTSVRNLLFAILASECKYVLFMYTLYFSVFKKSDTLFFMRARFFGEL